MLTLDANEFKKLLAKIDINTARELANNAISDAKTQSAYSAAGGLASAGIAAYGQYDKNQGVQPTSEVDGGGGQNQPQTQAQVYK
jgi:hypothetical protein